MSTSSLKSLLWPGGALVLGSLLLLGGGVLNPSTSAVGFYFWAVFLAGFFLAWRFHSSRVLGAFITLFLCSRAIEFFSNGTLSASGPGRIAFEAVALLLPLNFLLQTLATERGFSITALAPRTCLLFIEAVFVAVICRPDETVGPWFLHARPLGKTFFNWTPVTQPGLLLFVGAAGIIIGRALLYKKPIDIGLFWSLAAGFFALQAGGSGRVGGAYFGTAGLVLLASIIENSYFLAYHDELTGLPGRRSFNDAILQLPECYAVAAVDIDHFKSFNDTYGHETGDQVLRLVAKKLAQITGGGEAFRVGGEEFTILFRGKPATEVMPHVEDLRREIESSRFRVRGILDRRAVARGPDRRQTSAKTKKPTRRPTQSPTGELSVTVSMGVAEPSATLREAEQVIQAADKALYKAKQNGRNRVELASAQRVRRPRLKRSIA